MLLVSFWLSDDRSVAGMNEAAELWLKELGGGKRYPLPIEVFAVAAKLRALDHTDGFIPRLRVRRRAGHWALLRASITKPTTSDAALERLAKTIESVQPSAGCSMMP